ncbi:MAG TPA: hypothetical protein VGH27_30380 [Streptosporangiaceae bacterium]
MADEDWRVTVTLYDEALVRGAVESVLEHRVAEDASHKLDHHVAVSSDGPCVFLYASTEAAARQAEKVVREVILHRHLTAEYQIDRWHPIEEEWEDASVPLPQTAQEQQAEHERLVEEETRESQEADQAGWEVRVEMPSRHAAIELTEKLQAEGHRAARRWKYLVLGANNEDDAAKLAEQVKQEAPASASVGMGSVPFVPFGKTDIGGLPILPAE